MPVRMNLSIGDNLDEWISEKASQLGIAKNAFVIMCVANARLQEENLRTMSAQNIEVLRKMIESEERKKGENG